MERNTAYLARYKDTIKKLAVTFELSEDEVIEIIDHFFLTLKKLMTDIRMPTIKIRKWGTYKPSIGKIDWQIGRTRWFLGKGHGDEEKQLKKITLIETVKDRLLREKKGERTWEEWKNKQLEDYTKHKSSEKTIPPEGEKK